MKHPSLLLPRSFKRKLARRPLHSEEFLKQVAPVLLFMLICLHKEG